MRGGERGIHFLQVGSTTPIVFTSIYCSRENPKERCPRVISLLKAQYAAGESVHRATEVLAQSVAREIFENSRNSSHNHIGGYQFAYSLDADYSDCSLLHFVNI
jgi:hypothetical protein